MFQKTIVAKYLKTQIPDNLALKWDLFKKHFHNPEIQVNIRQSKEEQYQGEFLIDMFVNILGYTKNPTPNYNLTTEYKNVKDSKKADGAIIINSSVTAIIELKGTKTTDLSKIEDQAFGYKNNQPDCKYIITSNFEKLRFYIDTAIEHLEFNLFQLTFEQFQLLYLCLSYENIAGDIPKKIKAESLSQEDVITKKLYKDYSVFKRELFDNLTVLNPNYEPLELFKKSQKLLDRFLFLFFGEDRGLLPPNSVRLILEDWMEIRDRDEDVKLYGRFKKYFGYLNTGFKGKRYDVFAYNGGLFKPDEILDAIKIDDDLLYKHTLKLADYDFDSEVDVNILGHIFENSLNELDEIKAQLEGQEVDKSKTKRKKDGVFYTPKYITKYIVENTVGKLCEDKKIEFAIIEEDYFTDKKRQQKTKAASLKKLDDYRAWLHQITIIDPACGSGAFLNEALNFLIEEHQYIDELEAKLTGSSIAFTYHSESILENNLFGVDLNEESVEIAKLSLWLRTAEPNRKLNSLTDNIKCGNSLIDDPEVAGNKAFNWEQEFPQIFAKGGFDVVIGNPPYVRAENIDKIHREYYLSKNSKYKKTFGRFDLYILFNELGIEILKKKGYLSYIFPSSFFNQNYSSVQRDWILNQLDLIEIADLSKINVFKGVAVETAIIVIRNQEPQKNIFCSKPENEEIFLNKNKSIIDKSIFNNLPNKTFRAELDKPAISIISRIKNNSNFVEDFCYTVIGAVPHNSQTGASKDRLISNICDKQTQKKYLEGKDFNRYITNWSNKYLDYIPAEMHRPKFPELFENEKILVRNISTKEGLMATYDDNYFYVNDTMSILIPWYKLKDVQQKGVNSDINKQVLSSELSLKFLIAIINSQLINYYFKLILSSNLHVYPDAIRNLPVKRIPAESQKPFIEKADQMLLLNKELQEVSAKFQRTSERKFENLNQNKKLQDWYKLSYADFIKELTKQKIKLTLSEEAEWADYFDQEKSKALEIQSKIERTDKEIDQMVYKLYGLSKEEIRIVEKS